MIRDLDPVFEQRMINWSLWKVRGDSSLASSLTKIYGMAGASVPRFDLMSRSVPVIPLEAERVERAMRKLAELNDRWSIAVHAYWTASLGPEYLARRCGCCVMTFYNRVKRGHKELGILLNLRVEKIARNAVTHRIIKLSFVHFYI